MSNDWGHIYLEGQDKTEQTLPQRSTGENILVACVLGFAVIAVGALGFVWRNTQAGAPSTWQAAAPVTQPQPQTAAVAQAQPTLNYIPWDYSYENAMATARNQNKLVLMDFYTDWCGVCKKMDSETFVNPAVIAEAQNFVTIKINAEQRTDLAAQYNVSKYPTFIIADGSGNVKYNEAGGYDPANFARLLQMHRSS
jgi:thiol:disulfide interchange protein